MAQATIPQKGNRGHDLKWHAHVEEWHGKFVVNCPCMGKPQKMTKRLAARLKQFGHDEMRVNDRGMGLLHHKPGSQNRKK